MKLWRKKVFLSVDDCLIVSHLLLYLFVAWRGCHERWDDEFAHDGPAPLLLPLEPLPVDGGPLCGCCHGAHRLGHPPWLNAHDQPPLNVSIYRVRVTSCYIRFWVCSKSFVIFWDLSNLRVNFDKRIHHVCQSAVSEFMRNFCLWFFNEKWTKIWKKKIKAYTR